MTKIPPFARTHANFDPEATLNELEAYHDQPREVYGFQPLGDWMLVEPQVEPDVTESGLYKVRDEKPRPVRGTVLATGPDAHGGLKGKTVVFGKFTGVKIELDGKEYILLHQTSDVYGYLDD